MSEPGDNASKDIAEPAGSNENPAELKKEWDKELPVEAMNHLFQGKRHLLVHDYSSAVSSLQEACELFVKFYGPMAYECGEIHYYYGKALLELARQETGILGDALEGGSDGDESQENSGNSDEEAEGDKDSAEESKADSEEAEEESIGSSDQGKTDSDDQTKDCGGEGEKSDNAATESKPEGTSAGCSEEAGPSGSESVSEKEEDITTLQLAWEVLETAKVIFQRHSVDNRDDKLKVAEILLALGEISLEEENFQGSLEDLQECLRIHLQYLGPDDRLLAQTYYQLGLAYTFAADYDAALDSYQKSIDVIETRIGALKTQVVPDLPTDFSIKDPAKEIEELESLLPDIKAKIEDTEELKGAPKKLDEKEVQKKEEEEFGIPSKEFSGDSKKPVTNLTHLLKRKKPDDQDSSSAQPAAKKLMTAQSSSSEPVTNGGSNNNSTPVTSDSGV